MKIVWRRGSATVREVYETLREQRRLAYTTVMTVMQILEEKGYLRREKAARAHRYWPVRLEQTVIASMVRDFVNRVFDGASTPLLVHLVREGRLRPEEREELRRLIEEAD